MLGTFSFCLVIFGVVLFQVLCGVLVVRLKSRYPQIYRELGSPAPIDRHHTFLSELRRHDDFPALHATDRRLAEVSRLVSVLIYAFLFGAAVLTFSALR